MPPRDDNNIDGLIDETLTRYPNVPRDVFRRLVNVESGGNAAARSFKGALGLGQLMPDTARGLGLRVDREVDERLDPRKNIDASARYLSQNIAAFDGDVEKGVAAYHAGPGAVRKAGGIPKTHDGISATPDYVRKIVGGKPVRQLPPPAGAVRVSAAGPSGSIEKTALMAGVPADLQNSAAPDEPPVENPTPFEAEPVDPSAPPFERAVAGQKVRQLGPPPIEPTYQPGDVIPRNALRFPAGAPPTIAEDAPKPGIWDDLVNRFGYGWQTLGGDMREGVRMVGGDGVVDAIEKFGKQLGMADVDEEKAKLDAAQSPEMAAAMKKDWWDEENNTFGPAWTDVRAWGGGVAESLPGTLLTMVPAYRLGRAAEALTKARVLQIAGARGTISKAAATHVAERIGAEAMTRTATVAGGILEGLQGGAGSAAAVRDFVANTPDDVLDQSDAFKALVQQHGGDRAAAKKQLMDDAGTQAFLAAGVVTGIFGGFGDRFLAKALTKGIKGNIGTRIAKGAVSEGIFEEGPQSFGSAVAENLAKQQADPRVGTYEGAINQGVGGAAIGGIIGAGMGGVSGRRDDKPPPRPHGWTPFISGSAGEGMGSGPTGRQLPPLPPITDDEVSESIARQRAAADRANNMQRDRGDDDGPPDIPPPPAGEREPTEAEVRARLAAVAKMEDGDVGRPTDGAPFKARIAALGARKKQGLAETHDVVELAPDAWVLRPKVEEDTDAVQEQGAAGVDVREQAGDGKAVGSGDTADPTAPGVPRAPEGKGEAPVAKGGFVTTKAGNQVRIGRHVKGSNLLDPNADIGAFTYTVRSDAEDDNHLTMVLSKDGKLVEKKGVLNKDNSSNGKAWVPPDEATAAEVRKLLEQRADTGPSTPERKAIDDKIAAVVARKAAPATKPGPAKDELPADVKGRKPNEHGVYESTETVDYPGKGHDEKIKFELTELPDGRWLFGKRFTFGTSSSSYAPGISTERKGFGVFRSREGALRYGIQEARKHIAAKEGDPKALEAKRKRISKWLDAQEAALAGDTKRDDAAAAGTDRVKAQQKAEDDLRLEGQWQRMTRDVTALEGVTAEDAEKHLERLNAGPGSNPELSAALAAIKWAKPAKAKKDDNAPLSDEGLSNLFDEAAAEVKKEAKAEKDPVYGTKNTVFTASAADAARALLKKKLGNLNAGIDPEVLQAGITLAGYHIEAGARTFADYAKAMIADLGDTARPYLRSWYEAVRHYPGFDAEGMTPTEQIGSTKEGKLTPAEAEKLPDADPVVGATDAEVDEIGDMLETGDETDADEQQITHVFDAPKKDEVVRLADKVKVYHANYGWMTPAEAQARIREWEEHAVAQGKTSANSEKVVLSLFDRTGAWSAPWEQAGYDVWRFDIQNDPDMGDVNKFSTEFFSDWFGGFEGKDIYAVLAACPCTDFAVSGARHFAAKDEDGRTHTSVELVQQTLATIEFFKPAVWAIENPVGRIEKLAGLPPWRLSFDPFHVGHPYTKKTLLWGRFDADLPIAPVEPVEGSKMHTQFGGKSDKTKNARSETPEGFAYSFFMQNNAVDHPQLAVAGKYDRLDPKAIAAALDAGITPEEIDDIVADFYYMDLDDDAANEALREAAKKKGPTKGGDEKPPTERPEAPEIPVDKAFLKTASERTHASKLSAGTYKPGKTTVKVVHHKGKDYVATGYMARGQDVHEVSAWSLVPDGTIKEPFRGVNHITGYRGMTVMVGKTAYQMDREFKFVPQGEAKAEAKPEASTEPKEPSVETPLIFSSGMSRPGDFNAALKADHSIGIEIGELSMASMPKLAEALVAVPNARVFVDTGAFSLFRAGLRAAERGEPTPTFDDGATKAIDFNQMFKKFDAFARHLSEASEDTGGSAVDRVYWVMPDIVGSQSASIALLEEHKDEVKSHIKFANAIVPIQVGEMSLTQAYDKIVKLLDGYGHFIVGIPSNEKAVSDEEFRQFLKDRGEKIRGIHVLGAASEKKLGPRLEAMRATKFDGEVSADANRLRSLMYGDTDRAAAMRKLLGQDYGPPAPIDPASIERTKAKPYEGDLQIGDMLAVQAPGWDYVKSGRLLAIDGELLTWLPNSGKRSKPITITRWNIEVGYGAFERELAAKKEAAKQKAEDAKLPAPTPAEAAELKKYVDSVRERLVEQEEVAAKRGTLIKFSFADDPKKPGFVRLQVRRLSGGDFETLHSESLYDKNGKFVGIGPWAIGQFQGAASRYAVAVPSEKPKQLTPEQEREQRENKLSSDRRRAQDKLNQLAGQATVEGADKLASVLRRLADKVNTGRHGESIGPALAQGVIRRFDTLLAKAKKDPTFDFWNLIPRKPESKQSIRNREADRLRAEKAAKKAEREAKRAAKLAEKEAKAAARAAKKAAAEAAKKAGSNRKLLNTDDIDLRRHWELVKAEKVAADEASGKAFVNRTRDALTRATLFEGLAAEGATPGTQRYIERVRDATATFMDALFKNRGPLGNLWGTIRGRGKQSESLEAFMSGESYPAGERAREFYKDIIPEAEMVSKGRYEWTGQDATRDQRIAALKRAGDNYLAAVSVLTDALRGSKDVADAASRVATALFPNHSGLMPQSLESFRERYKPTEELEGIGEKAKQVGLVIPTGREIVPLGMNDPGVQALKNSEAKPDDDTGTTKRKPLRPPPIELQVRTGLKDHREGPVTPIKMRDDLGLASVGFGTWVAAKTDQVHLNSIYDAFNDLADVIGIPAKLIGLEKSLHFTLGALGHGSKAAATYHHGHPGPGGGTVNAINLTKTRGDGTVAHEWGHALDYFIRGTGEDGRRLMHRIVSLLKAVPHSETEIREAAIRGLKGHSYIVGNKRATPTEKAAQLVDYYDGRSRSSKYKYEADKLGANYWGNDQELFARAWEAWVFDHMKDRSQASNYLVNPWVADGVTGPPARRGTPYPVGEERKFFNTVMRTLTESLVVKGDTLTVDATKFDTLAQERWVKEQADAVQRVKDEIIILYAQMQEEQQAAADKAAGDRAKAESDRLAQAEAAKKAIAALEAADAEEAAATEEPDANGPLADDELDDLFDEAAASVDENRIENPNQPAPGITGIYETPPTIEEIEHHLVPPVPGEPPPTDTVVKPDDPFQLTDLRELRDMVAKDHKVIFSGEGAAHGLPTIQSLSNARHMGYGVFEVTTPEYKASFVGGSGMSRQGEVRYTTLTETGDSPGKAPYDKAGVLATLDRMIAEREAGEAAPAAAAPATIDEARWKHDLTTFARMALLKEVGSKKGPGVRWDALTRDEQRAIAALGPRVDELTAKGAGKPPAPEAPKAASELIGDAAKLGVKGIDDALTGLTKLFGGGKIQTFPGGFDEDAYQAAKPHFIAALKAFQDAGRTLKDLFAMLYQRFGETVKPYAVRFAKEMGLGARLGPDQTPTRKVADWVKGQINRPGSGSAPNAVITWSELFKQADAAWGGTQAEGKYTPKDAYDAAEAGMNLHILEDDKYDPTRPSAEGAKKVVAELEDRTKRLPTQTKRTAEQDAYQQFSTPPALAYVANWVANITPGETYLEPSAGTGGLAVFGELAGASIVANELAARRAAVLRDVLPDADVHQENAEHLHAILPPEIKPTVVVMNPPFSASAERLPGTRDSMIGAEHVEQALKRLAPGGRLVAIVGEPMGMDKPRFAPWWKKIRAEYSVRAAIPVSGAGYAKYGTTYDNVLLVIDRAGPTVAEPITTAVKAYDELPALLEGVRNARTAPQVAAGTGSGEVATGAVDRTPPAGPGAVGDSGVGGARDGPRKPADDRAGGVADPSAAKPATGGRSGVGGRPGGRVDPVSGKAGGGTGPEGRGDDGVRGDTGVDGGSTGVTLDTAAVLKREDELTDSLFDQYAPKKARIKGSKPHPGPLVESSAMAAVEPPDVTYTPNLPRDVIEKGLLSDAQLEAVIYAGQAHEQFLPDSEERRGFMVGDGTGVGKGREISGVILDNMRQGRKRAVWISEKPALADAAKRDWTGIGQKATDLFLHNDTNLKGEIPVRDGILFTTYKLVSMDKSVPATDSTPAEKHSRLEQLVNWLGADFDGVIAFDESHNMSESGGEQTDRGAKDGSKQAIAGIELQKRLPKARFIYVSATGATEVGNLRYATRLGLWGPGTPFATPNDFMNKIAATGVAAMELVAQDLKAMGSYIARSLSYDGVAYDRAEVALTPLQLEIYDEMAEAWQIVVDNIDAALKLTKQDKNPKAKGNARAQLWGALQRFFNQVITAFQTPDMIALAKQHVENGGVAAFQFVNTNEAAQEKIAKKAEAEGIELEELDFTPKEGLFEYIRNGFPVQKFETYRDPESGKVMSRPVNDSAGNPVIDPEAVAMREKLLAKLKDIRVPGNPLDDIIDAFGHDQVAEITGRKRRYVKIPNDEGDLKIVEQKRGAAANDVDSKAFMNDQRKVLVFSNAGGTGFSYHADLKAKNQRERLHIMLQPGWSATKAVQALGRTHRSNQKQPPRYVLPYTTLRAQKRFVSSIARRLDQLGALTKGSRQTGSQGLYTNKDNLESQYAIAAMTALMVDMVKTNDPLLKPMGLDDIKDPRTGGIVASKHPTIQKFLNRLLALKVSQQNEVFEKFEQRMDAAIEAAIAQGTYDDGMQTLKALKVVQERIETIHTDKRTNANTHFRELAVVNAVVKNSWEKVLARGAKLPDTTPMRFYRDTSKPGSVFALIDLGVSTLATGAQVRKGYRIDQRAPDGRTMGRYVDNVQRIQDQSEMQKQYAGKGHTYAYEEMTSDEAAIAWEPALAKVPDTATKKLHLLTGTLLPVWDRIPERGGVVRTQLDSGERIIGKVIPEADVASLLKKFNLGAVKADIPAQELMDRILAGETAVLSNGWQIKKVRVSNDDRLEFVQSYMSMAEQANLVKQGVIQERIGWQDRFFIPTDAESFERATRGANRPVVEFFGKKQQDADFATPSSPSGWGSAGPGFDPLARQVAAQTATGVPLTDAQSQADAEALRQVLEDHLRRADPRARIPAGAIQPIRLPDDVALNAVARNFSKRVVGIRVTDPQFLFFGGATKVHGANDVIFIVEGHARPHMSILGHELLHNLRVETPDVYNRMLAALMPMLRANWRKHHGDAAAKRAWSNHTEDKNLEEFLADMVGEAMLTPEFWQRLGKASPSLLQRVYNAMRVILDKMKRALSGAQYPTRAKQYINDWAKAVNLAADAMAEYGLAHSWEQPDPGYQPSFAARGGPTWRSALTDALANAPFAKDGSIEAAQLGRWLDARQRDGKFKKDEVEATGIKEWLDGQKRVTRASVDRFMQANGVQLGEVLLGGTEQGKNDPVDQAIVELTALGWQPDIDPVEGLLHGVTNNADGTQAYAQDIDTAGAVRWADENEEPLNEDSFPTEIRERAEALGRLLEERVNDQPMASGATRYARGKLILPGGEEQRELLLTLPHMKSEGARGNITFKNEDALDDFMGDVSAEGFEDLDYGAVDNRHGDRVVAEFDGLTRKERGEFEKIAARYGGHLVYEVDPEAPAFRSSHYPQNKNLVVHVRFNERKDKDGKRIMFIEETQSDWAQRGRKLGFTTGDMDADLNKMAAELNAWYDKQGLEHRSADEWDDDELTGPQRKYLEKFQVRWDALETDRAIKAAPFVTKTEAWVQLSIKRILRYAADNGFDGVAFTTGQQQADRYNLEHHVKEVRYLDAPTTRRVDHDLNAPEGKGRLMAYDHRDVLVIDKEVSHNELDEYVGKDVADRLLKAPPIHFDPQFFGRPSNFRRRTLKGLDLRVGGEKQRAFYDEILPPIVNDVLKKHGGGKMGAVPVKMPVTTRHFVNLHPDRSWAVFRGEETDRVVLMSTHRSLEEARDESNRLNEDSPQDQPGFYLTDANREAVSEGVPMFSAITSTETPAFRRWFRNSKVVDADGNPLVVYHGTRVGTFSVFNTANGAYFSADKDYAKRYTKRPFIILTDEKGNPLKANEGRIPGGAKPKLYPVYLSLQNPKIIGNRESGFDASAIDSSTMYLSPKDIEDLKSQGYDGVMNYGAKEFIAFEPTQIKSATSNNGAYDPENPNIDFDKLDSPWRQHVEYVKVTTRNGRTVVDVVRGRNEADAMARARRSWPSPAKVVKITEDEARAEDPTLVDHVQTGGPDFDKLDNPGSAQEQLVEPDPRRNVGRGIVNRIRDTLAASPDGFSWWHKTVGTQFHKAWANPAYGRVFRLAQKFIEDATKFARDPSELAPNLLPQMDSFRHIVGDLLGKAAPAKDVAIVSKALFEGTLDKQRKPPAGLTQKQLELFDEARVAIDRSVDILAASTAAVLTRNMTSFPKIVRERAKVAPEDAPAIYDTALTAMQRVLQQRRAKIEKAKKAQTDALDKRTGEAVGKLKKGEVGGRAAIMFEAQEELLAIESRFDAALDDIQARLDVVEDAMRKVRKTFTNAMRLKDEGYVPLMRFGRYTITVTDVEAAEDGREPTVWFSMHESKADAIAMRRKLTESGEFKDMPITFETMSQEKWRLFEGVSPDALALFADVTDLARDPVMQQYLQKVLNNRNALKRLIKRKGTAGYDEDIRRVLSSFLLSNARLASRNYHYGEMLKAASQLDTQPGDVQDEAVKLVKYVQHPEEEAGALRGLLFLNFLGGSVASAAVNMTQPVTMSLPYLSQYGGVAKASAALAEGMKIATGINKPQGALKVAMDRAATEGLTEPHEIYQLQAEASRNLGSNIWWRRGVKAWGMMFAKAEAFNREATFAAAFSMAQGMTQGQLAKAGANSAYQFAERAVQDTQGIYSKANRPNLARGAIGATVMTFKQFSIAYLEFLKRLPPKERALAIAILILAAGLQGLPFAEDLEDMIDTLAQAAGYRWNTRRQARKWATQIVGEPFAGFLMQGTSGVPGFPIDVSARMGLGNLVPGTSLLKRSEAARGTDVAEFLGPVAGLARSAGAAGTAALELDLGGALKAGAPVAAQNAMKAMDMWQTGMYRDTRGRRVTDATGVEAAGKALGFQPKTVADAQRRAREGQQDVAQVRSVEADIASTWAEGVFLKDQKKIDQAREQLREWNRKNPDFPIRVSMQQIQKRVKAMREERQSRLVRAAPKEVRRTLVEELEE